jgi:tRNA A-37 threonylcarbamoyl transferase component Bud32
VVLKHNPVRQVALADGAVLKLFLAPSRRSFREARTLRKAAALGVPVPELLAVGRDWVATRWAEGRPALPEDLPRLLPIVDHMHEHGMLHCDLHLGNFLVQDEHVVLIFWREVRAHQHWRSRTRRCLKESSGFTRFTAADSQGFRRREADPEALSRALETLDQAELIWPRPGGQLYRSGPWVVKQHANVRAARSAWVAGHGLETRGIRTGRQVAWVDRWLIMEHAGGTAVESAEACFTRASPADQEEMMRTLADLLADLHRRGIYHADLKASNVTWSPGQPARLLDYQRVRFGIRVSQRRRSKNLAQLNASLPDIVPGPLRARGLNRYLERSEFRGDARKLRQTVIALSLRRSHRWHGC